MKKPHDAEGFLGRGTLTLDSEGENDYTLAGSEHCWLTVGNKVSVLVNDTEEGVIIDVYPLGQEMAECAASIGIHYNDLPEAQEAES